jgi:hypothetical protein
LDCFLASLSPLHVAEEKGFHICNATVKSELMAELGLKIYSILTAIMFPIPIIVVAFFPLYFKGGILLLFLGFLLSSKYFSYW